MPRELDTTRHDVRVETWRNNVSDTLTQALEQSERIGRVFDPGADFWQDFYAHDPNGADRLRVFDAALASIGARGRWLDAGCGIGVMVRHFRAAGLRVWGIDMAAQLLDEAQRVTDLPLVADARRYDGEHLVRAPVERLPYGDAQFDGVYSSSVLEYVADIGLALTELGRVVRTGGHLVFSLPNAFSVSRIAHALRGRPDRYFEMVPRWAYWRWEIVRELRRAGWDAQRFSYFGETRRLRGRIAKQPWGAFFVLVVARRV